MTRLVLMSTAVAEDAGYRALADVVAAAQQEPDVDYRIIGGHMVSVHSAGRVIPAPPRATADADVGLAARLVGSGALLQPLRAAGYELTAGNRLERQVGGVACAIDVLIPAETSRVRHNRKVGELYLDEVPGLDYALARPAHVVDVEARLTSGERLLLRPHVADLVSALCVKVFAYATRWAPRDALDVWRLLEVARLEELNTANWPTSVTPARAARLLRHHFVPARGSGVLAATSDQAQQTRLRALARALAGCE